MAPFPVLAEGLGNGAVGPRQLRHDQRLGDEIGALPAIFLRDGKRAKAELRAFLDDLPIERFMRRRDGIARQRDRADFLVGEFSRRHLPVALLVA